MDAKTEITPQQSIDTINEMIGKAKRSYLNQSFYYLLWGAIMAIAGIAAFTLMKTGVEHFWLPWPILAIIGAIASGVYGAKQSKVAPQTFTDRVFTFLWGGYTVCLIIGIGLMVLNNLDPNPYVLIITGLATFVSGGVIRFKPLLIGGVFFWVAAIAAYFVPEFSSLIFSVGIIIGYLIPGFLLKKGEK